MRLLPLLAVIGLVFGWPPASSAQTGPPAPNMAVRVTEARKAKQLSVQVQNFNYNRNN